MIRPAIILILMLSAVFMMQGLAGDWRAKLSAPAQEAAKKAGAPEEGAAGGPLPKAKPLQPKIPSTLPDLKTGYLFNQERMLASEALPAAESGSGEGVSDNTQGISASIDEVIYTGSVITDASRLAIIAYPAAPKAGGPQRPQFLRGKGPAPAGPEEYARLSVGEVLAGYQVKEILPDRLILVKGDETVEKLLYDPEKKRQAAPPRVPATAGSGGAIPPLPARPQLGSGVMPPPASGGESTAPAASAPAVLPRAYPPNPNAEGGSPLRSIRRRMLSRQRDAAGVGTSGGSMPQDAGGGITLPPGGRP